MYSLYNKTTRIKLVCVNNKVELYFGEVDTATGKVKGEYVRIAAFDAVDTSGYLGIGSDSPAYFEIDNFAVTPVSREATLEFAASGKTAYRGFRGGRRSRKHGKRPYAYSPRKARFEDGRNGEEGYLELRSKARRAIT